MGLRPRAASASCWQPRRRTEAGGLLATAQWCPLGPAVHRLLVAGLPVSFLLSLLSLRQVDCELLSGAGCSVCSNILLHCSHHSSMQCSARGRSHQYCRAAPLYKNTEAQRYKKTREGSKEGGSSHLGMPGARRQLKSTSQREKRLDCKCRRVTRSTAEQWYQKASRPLLERRGG